MDLKNKCKKKERKLQIIISINLDAVKKNKYTPLASWIYSRNARTIHHLKVNAVYLYKLENIKTVLSISIDVEKECKNWMLTDTLVLCYSIPNGQRVNSLYSSWLENVRM